MAKKKDQKEETIVDVQEVYTKTEMFVDKYRKPLTSAILVIVILIIGYFAYDKLYIEPREEQAAEEMWKAEQYFMMDSLELAMYGDNTYPGFQDISEQYSGTVQGDLANYYMGIILREQGDYQSALEYFQKADINDDVISVINTGNIGDMHVELGQIEEAIPYFEKAANAVDNSALTPVYLMKAGMAYQELGEKAKAQKMYERIVDNYPKSRQTTNAKKLLAAMPEN
jgi:tetratricopeptide (TPR) repeat protein